MTIGKSTVKNLYTGLYEIEEDKTKTRYHMGLGELHDLRLNYDKFGSIEAWISALDPALQINIIRIPGNDEMYDDR